MTSRELIERLLPMYAIASGMAENLASTHANRLRDDLRAIIVDLTTPAENKEERSSLASAPVIKFDATSLPVACPICHNLTHRLYDREKYYCPKCDFSFGRLIECPPRK